jgi:aspartate racemase
MGPAASAAFLVELAARYPAATDQEHPRVLLLSDPAIPDRSTALLRGDDAPLAAIRSGLHTLVSWGATLLTVPCNSAHFWVEQLADELPCPVLSIVDATLDEAVAKSPEGAWLLATTGTVAAGVYQRRARDLGYRLHIPSPAQQTVVQAVIDAVKGGDVEGGAVLYTQVHGELRGEHDLPLVNACTELPLAAAAAGSPGEGTVSSVAALVAATIDALTSSRVPA